MLRVVNWSILIGILLFFSCCNSNLTPLDGVTVIDYGNGLIRKGHYKEDIPFGTHFFYKNGRVFKKIQYRDWSEEFLKFYKANEETYNLGKIDTAKLDGFPNSEIYVENQGLLDSARSNFAIISIKDDSTLHFEINISKFKNYIDESAHLFVFKENVVRYIIEDKFNFELKCSVGEVQKVLSKDYRCYSFVAVREEDSQVQYQYIIPLFPEEVQKIVESERPFY